MDLLNRTRRINHMLQRVSGPVNFSEMSEVLSEVIGANIFVVSRKGKLLGYSIAQEIENERMAQMLEARQFPEEYTEGIMRLQETSSNLDINNSLTVFPVEMKDIFNNALTTVVPIVGGGDRLGTLV